MINIKNILCPVDFSDFSAHALAHAFVIARWYKATVTLFYAYAVRPPPVLFAGLPVPVPGEPFPPLSAASFESRAEIIAELTRLAEALGGHDVEAHYEARAGGTVTAILEEADALNADLIVLGTHGRSGFDRWALGSVTEKVLRKAAHPVLTVPPPVSQPPDTALWLMKRILCPIDFSDASLKAVEYSLSLAQEADAQLLLMHVIEGMPDTAHWKQPDPAIVEYLRSSEERALAQLRAVVPQDAHSWCHIEELLVPGKPHQEILRVARERDVHLVVMGVHGRNPIDLMFFGSTAQQVIRAAPSAVLTLRG